MPPLFVFTSWEDFLKISRKCVGWGVEGFSFRLNGSQQYCAWNYEKKCKYRISIIKAKPSFFWTSNSEGHGSHGNKFTSLFLGSVNFPMSVISTNNYFVEIGWVHQKLYIFKCTMLKTLNSDFLDWEGTLSVQQDSSLENKGKNWDGTVLRWGPLQLHQSLLNGLQLPCAHSACR